MENFLDFEKSKIFQFSSIGLGAFNILFIFTHIFLLSKINKNKERVKNIITETTILSIIFQIISSSLFFGLLYKLYIQNTKFLSISHLIGIALCLEWLSFYLYYSDGNKIINIIFYLLIPLVILLSIFLLFFFVDDFNKNNEMILKNISFIFYALMIISPGINISYLIHSENFQYIIIINIIIGLLNNIFMILFIIALNHFNIIELYFIVYNIISLLICIIEIIYYIIKKNKGFDLYNDVDDINPSFNDYSKDNDSRHKKISLVNRNSVEDI